MAPFAAMGQAEVEFKRLEFEISTLAVRSLRHSIDEADLTGNFSPVLVRLVRPPTEIETSLCALARGSPYWRPRSTGIS